MSKLRLYALVHEVDGEMKLAHRIKRVYSIYSNPITNRPLVFNTYEKAERAMRTTSTGNYLPKGTKIISLIEEPTK